MTETLKEAKPSEAALEAAYIMKGGTFVSERLDAAYSIDVAPLIADCDNWESIAKAHIAAWQEVSAERDALKERVAESERERDDARAENDAHETQDSVIIQNYFDIGRELGAIGSPFEAMVALRQRAESAESSLVASQRQVEALKEALTQIENYTGLGCDVSIVTTNRVNSMAAVALSALDAPQEPSPDPRDAAKEAARDEARWASNAAKRNFSIAQSRLTERDEARRDLAEAVEVMRPFSDAWKNALGLFDRPHTQAVIEAVAKYYIEASHLKRASAFVEKHAPKPPAEMTEEELLAGLDEITKPFDPATSPGHTDLMISPEAIDEALAADPLPEELARPVTEEEITAAVVRVYGEKPIETKRDAIRAALESFLAGRAKR